MTILSFENIHKKYGKQVVLNDVNFSIDKGCTVILGPSGAGKSTLLRCINMLETPNSGSIYYHGKKISSKNISKIRRKISMVFQQFNLFLNMTVLENLTYAPLFLGNHKNNEDINDKAFSLLKKFGLSEKSSFLPKRLSGGQKQRVAICRALMMEPEVIMFDEPTSALDVESVKGLISIIKELEQNTTIIVVTHHVEFAKAVAKHVIFMDSGMILDTQSKEEFFKKPKSYRAQMFLENMKYDFQP